MEAYQEIIQVIALTMGAAWASGINLYATVAALGIAGASGYLALPVELELIQDPLVILAAGFMYCVEFFADKTPGVDSAWDGIHTFIRVPAGALLAAGAVGDVSPAVAVAAGFIGGTVAASTHVTKAGTRLLINTSPEPFSNWGASVLEDVVVLGGLWAALTHPALFLGAFILFTLLIAWLVPKIFRGVGRVTKRFRRTASAAEVNSAQYAGT